MVAVAKNPQLQTLLCPCSKMPWGQVMVLASAAELQNPHGKATISPCSCAKDLLASPLLPTLTGLGTDQVTWMILEQLQIQKGILVPMLNISLEESLVWRHPKHSSTPRQEASGSESFPGSRLGLSGWCLGQRHVLACSPQGPAPRVAPWLLGDEAELGFLWNMPMIHTCQNSYLEAAWCAIHPLLALPSAWLNPVNAAQEGERNFCISFFSKPGAGTTKVPLNEIHLSV